MSIKNDIKGYIVTANSSVAQLADEIGITRQSLNIKINNESLRYSDAIQIADILGYEIIWKKKEK